VVVKVFRWLLKCLFGCLGVYVVVKVLWWLLRYSGGC